MVKKLAVLLHGQSYSKPEPIPVPTLDNQTMEMVINYCSRCKCSPNELQPLEYQFEKQNRTFQLDYQKSVQSLRENVFEVFKTVFEDIDVYIITHKHVMISKLIQQFKPKKIKIIHDENYSNLLIEGLKLVQNNSIDYSHVLALRFDNFYPSKFPIERLDMNAVNITWKTPDLYNSEVLFVNWSNLHNVIYNLPLDNVHYLCKKLDIDKEVYPDFVFPQKRLKAYNENKLQLKQVADNFNLCMTMSVSKHIVIITSCINPDSSPLCYYPCRSLYTPEERLEHTLVSIATVRAKIPNVTIVLMNNNYLTHVQHVKLLEKCDYVFIFDSLKLDSVVLTADFVRSFPNKSCSETASLYYACDRIEELELQYDYLWKLSGRSYLRPEFDVEDWPPFKDKLIGPPKGYGINNTLYCIPKEMVWYYKERLKHCCISCYHDPNGENGSMVEWTLFEIAKNPESTTHYFLPCLAYISGLCTVDASHKHWLR